MWNSIGSWFCIMGLVIGPFSVGVLFEEKAATGQPGTRLAAAAQVLEHFHWIG